MKVRFTLVGLILALALPATALAGFTRWTPAKTESTLLAKFRAKASPSEIERLIAEWKDAYAEEMDARAELWAFRGSPTYNPAYPPLKRRYDMAKRRTQQVRDQLAEARNGRRPFDARCTGMGWSVNGAFRKLQCVVVFETERWQILVLPLDGLRFAYSRV
jgi:hypothetical protein